MAILDNIVAAFKFDESTGNALDSSGNNFTLTNSGCTYSTGLINNAVYGGTSYGGNKHLDRNGMSQTLNGAFSISLWIKMRAQITTAQLFHIVNWRGSSDSLIAKYAGFWNSNQPTISVNIGTLADQVLTAIYTIPTSSFAHIVITVPASGTMTLYINGSSVSTATRTTKTGGGDMTAFFQAADQSSSDGACIYDIAGFWARELTSGEVTTLYNGGAGVQYPFVTTNIKTINGLAQASVKTVNGLAIASVKTWNGLA